jgi:hypothetical protein
VWVRRNKSTTDQSLYICGILEKKWEHNETVHSAGRGVLYSILIEFGVPLKLVRLIKMCLNETYSKVLIGNCLSHNFPIQNYPKKRRCFTATACQVYFRICHVNLLRDNTDAIKKHRNFI